MYALEIAFVVATAALLVAINVRRATRRQCAALFVAGLGIAALAFALDQARIHMAPAALVFLAVSLLLLKRSYSHITVRSVAVALGMVLVAASVALALAMPIVTLPAPEGPYTVGVTSFTLVDESRNESGFGAPEKFRETYVQAWYPADIPDDALPPPRALWKELYRPIIFRVLFGYLSGIATHSYENLPLSSARNSYPAIVFSPALAGIAEQNTLLAEHLASHGYIFFGVTHAYFGMFTNYSDGGGVPVSDKVMEAMSQQGSVDLNELEARAKQTSDPLTRARVWLEYFERGTLLNELMPVRVKDLRLLLDAITMPNDEPRLPSTIVDRVDTNRIGLMGMSYGGGAVTELCKADVRCRAIVNLDGGLWGSRMRQPLDVPALVLASPNNRVFFDHDLLTSEAPYYAATLQGASHSNFTDVSAFVPLFMWMGVTGPIDGRRAVALINATTKRFFDAYLSDTRSPAIFEPDRFSELTVETNQSR